MLTDFQKKKFRILFNRLDSIGNGVLQWRDVMVHMDKIKQRKGWTDENPRFIVLMTAEMAYWDKMLERVDADGDGIITSAEFEAFYDAVAEQIKATGAVPPWALELLRAKFEVLDIDGNGNVDADEFGVYLGAIGCEGNHDEIFSMIDLDGDGTIRFDELETLFKQYVLSNDPAEPGNYIMCGACQ